MAHQQTQRPLIPKFWKGLWYGLAFGVLVLLVFIIWSLTVRGLGTDAFRRPDPGDAPIDAPGVPERNLPAP